ncbi:MAG TPA: FAD-dependent oxidoreductase [Prosthecobacter sp.]
MNHESNRRSFLRHALLGSAVVPWVGAAQAEINAPRALSRNALLEPERELKYRDDVDVIVCGGGPAGIAAAIHAARAGARTRLFEVNGCLGGVWTSGLLTYIFDFNKPGLTSELMKHLDERGAKNNASRSSFVYKPEEMKLLVEELCLAAGVKIQLHTRVVAAYKEGNKLASIVTESKSGREAWKAKVFIDATGDGDLGALAGCAWEIGVSGDQCPCQPMTMNALAVVKDHEAIKDYMSFFRDQTGHHTASGKLMKELERAAIKPSYGRPTIFHIHGDLVMLMLNHEYGVKAFDAEAVSDATIRSRSEIHKLTRALRGLGGIWEGIQVASTAEHIGVRDGRRIAGRYAVVKNDLVTGARHEDAVTRATFNVDVHAFDKAQNDKKPISKQDVVTLPYDIPLRALIARDVDGLMMAGRCISGDFIAHASYRVTGNAVAMGEAAGTIAAIAAQTNRLPHDVPWAEGAKMLARTRAGS